MKVDPIDMVVVNFYPFEKVAVGPELGRRDRDREHRHRRPVDGEGLLQELPVCDGRPLSEAVPSSARGAQGERRQRRRWPRGGG